MSDRHTDVSVAVCIGASPYRPRPEGQMSRRVPLPVPALHGFDGAAPRQAYRDPGRDHRPGQRRHRHRPMSVRPAAPTCPPSGPHAGSTLRTAAAARCRTTRAGPGTTHQSTPRPSRSHRGVHQCLQVVMKISVSPARRPTSVTREPSSTVAVRTSAPGGSGTHPPAPDASRPPQSLAR